MDDPLRPPNSTEVFKSVQEVGIEPGQGAKACSNCGRTFDVRDVVLLTYSRDEDQPDDFRADDANWFCGGECMGAWVDRHHGGTAARMRVPSIEEPPEPENGDDREPGLLELDDPERLTTDPDLAPGEALPDEPVEEEEDPPPKPDD